MANTENTKETRRLDDERRVRVLSPGMLVFKRFSRNRLAVVGTIIIVIMFLFAFIGGAISPYKEDQVFRTTTMESKSYAGVRENTDFLYTDAPDQELPAIAKTQAILAINNGEESFESQGVTYSLIKESDECYRVVEMNPVANVTTLGTFPRSNRRRAPQSHRSWKRPLLRQTARERPPLNWTAPSITSAEAAVC